ncbi:hypothetical protein Sru01_07980 [Sphaerisporangium rufum]|uniref:Winged helix-turn-helix domain-containing protein n=1 Tax=Sphaerisporangium rufum TaxID=1381558 RepID=A0A919QX99_9ACTN|nr:LuxR family transcriptional regulator [Sphaerisporangium rufum]GII75816.1 hypothetical protein Sru01_07980 [Sphaerisporangium rufum]
MTGRAGAGGLPAETTRLVGRRREIAEITRRLQTARLVTLTGVGGVGKTRLALRIARNAGDAFPGGVRFADLSGLPGPAALGRAVRAALASADGTGGPMAERLARLLAGRLGLLVLDGCEHVAEACASVVAALLAAVPALTVLATSRRVLGVPGESPFQVEPLPVEAPEDAGRNGAGDGGGEGAVALFADRAAAALPGFAPTPEVALLCRRLDGIPLAVELAAARLGTLTVGQLIRGAGDRFGLLADGGPAGSPRHRSLRAAIGWSHELCAPLERLLWARLSVFEPGFDLAAVRAVCADADPGRGLPAELVEDVLVALVDRSIVQRVDTGREIRFRMLDTVREYGAERLRELGLRAATRRRHREHYLALACRFDREWFGPDQVAWRARMSEELPNLRAVLDSCLADPAEHATALALAGRLAYLWMACGLAADGRHYLGRALAAGHVPGENRCRALWACAWLADLQGDLDTANDLATECLSEAFARRDQAAAGWGTVCCATTGLHWGYLAEALAMYEQARATHEDGGDREAGLAYTLVCEAYALTCLRRPEQALSRLRRQRSLSECRGDVWLRSSGDRVRSLIELDRGDARAAERFARAALRDKHRLHDGPGTADALSALAAAVASLGRMDRAARLLGVLRLVEDDCGLRAGRPRPMAPGAPAERQARAVLGDRAFEAAYDAARAQDRRAALEYALEETG